jgi:RND family efflux transporter MFP subunit
VKHYSLGLVILLSFILQACGGSSDGGPNSRDQRGERATSVETRNVALQDISRQIRSFGTVQAQDIVQVTPQVGNRITRIYADLGDTVSQGHRLAKIYDATAQDQVQQAQAQLEQSQANLQRDSLQYARQKKLLDRELISEAEFDDVRATYQNSKAQLQSNRSNLTQSRENLQNTIIRSPVYGVVLTRNVSQGDLASSGQVAFEIGNLTGLETQVYLPLEEWRRVNVGQEVSFSLSNEEQSTAEGSVTRISPRLDPTTGLGEVIISFTDKGSSIFQGVLVEAEINVETHKNAVVIPRAALVENVQTLIEPESNTIQIERNYSVFIVQDDSIAIKRDLELGIEQGDQIEILSGLQANDQIVITGQTSLEDSSKVRVVSGNNFQDRSVPIGNGQQNRPQGENRSISNDSARTDSSSTNSNSN